MLMEHEEQQLKMNWTALKFSKCYKSNYRPDSDTVPVVAHSVINRGLFTHPQALALCLSKIGIWIGPLTSWFNCYYNSTFKLHIGTSLDILATYIKRRRGLVCEVCRTVGICPTFPHGLDCCSNCIIQASLVTSRQRNELPLSTLNLSIKIKMQGRQTSGFRGLDFLASLNFNNSSP